MVLDLYFFLPKGMNNNPPPLSIFLYFTQRISYFLQKNPRMQSYGQLIQSKQTFIFLSPFVSLFFIIICGTITLLKLNIRWNLSSSAFPFLLFVSSWYKDSFLLPFVLNTLEEALFIVLNRVPCHSEP